MKFGKLIQKMAEEVPDAQFLRYKKLKKLIKRLAHSRKKKALQPHQCRNEQAAPTQKDGRGLGRAERVNHADQMSSEEVSFLKSLNEDIYKLNAYFSSAQEKVVGRLKSLGSELHHLQNSSDVEHADGLKAALIPFHGEIVILLHWGLLNQAAIKKIVKKHDKVTGVPLRAEYHTAIYRQPFFKTEPLARLAEKLGLILEQVMNETERVEPNSGEVDRGMHAKTQLADRRLRITQLALEAWQDMQHNASTPSTVLISLPSIKNEQDVSGNTIEGSGGESSDMSSSDDGMTEYLSSRYFRPINSNGDLVSSYSI